MTDKNTEVKTDQEATPLPTASLSGSDRIVVDSPPDHESDAPFPHMALDKLQRRAARGESEAQFELCIRYREGRGVESDPETAFKWCQTAAEQGHPWAQANLGWMFESGEGVAQNSEQAATCYRQAAEAGLPNAMNWYGQMLEVGKGVEENPTEAFFWYRSAAEQDDADGQYNVGLCYQFGKGVGKSEAEALHWYEKAGDQKHVDALYNLGWLYNMGRGVTQDKGRAQELFTEAGSDDQASEWVNRAMDYDQGRGGVAKDLAKANAWYMKAAKEGNVMAMFSLGVNHEYGRGTEKSWKAAKQWYKQAAQAGHQEAAFRYRFRYLLLPNGSGAIRFFRHAGVIKGSARGAETSRAASTVIGSFGRSNAGRRRMRIRGSSFFLQSELGGIVPIELAEEPELPLFAGQQVSLIYAMQAGAQSGPYLLMFNHEHGTEEVLTTAKQFWQTQMMGSTMLVAIAGIVIVALPILLGMMEWPAAEPDSIIDQLCHPFNWFLFIPLAAAVGFWFKAMWSKRAVGIKTLRRHLSLIRQWAKEGSSEA
ncbi:MAG: tetratricopeptide repeat protein [Mariprofundales bacterium]